ncbi:hypothetical protein GCM10010912_50890 [Paenibacillus albidus]|uniref:Uncharacterized protein n=1 Tax=Paenibacillus albidus TaxID=2041023 RepID=A0A917FSL5_9BACL|nr:hypothetical protein GCM10010912_50890 [Paenibacillus albidus]
MRNAGNRTGAMVARGQSKGMVNTVIGGASSARLTGHRRLHMWSAVHC